MSTTERERLIAEASRWSGWCTDNELTLLSDFLLDVKHQMALDRPTQIVPEEQVKLDQQMQKARLWENPIFICPRPVRSTDPANCPPKEGTQ